MSNNGIYNSTIEVLNFFKQEDDKNEGTPLEVEKLKAESEKLKLDTKDLGNESEAHTASIDDLTMTVLELSMNSMMPAPNMEAMAPQPISLFAVTEHTTPAVPTSFRSTAMYERLKRMYLAGRINGAYLSQAVVLGWITQEEMNDIIASRVF